MIASRLPLLVAALLLAACATGRGGAEDEAERITITVRNDLRPASAVTVRLLAEGGARHLLGTVAPQSTRTVPLEVVAVTGSYYLVAEAADGRELRSRSFALSAFDQVDWSLFNNSIGVRSP